MTSGDTVSGTESFKTTDREFTLANLDTLSNLFGYFKTLRTCRDKLRYFHWDGQVHLTKDKTGGQQGDPLEMLVFNLTIHN